LGPLPRFDRQRPEDAFRKLSAKIQKKIKQIKMGRQPRSGDSSLAIGPFDPD
jgi:hypothetical protein